MGITLAAVLSALPSLLGGGRELLSQIQQIFGKEQPESEAELKAAIADLEADNDEGRARYRAKLERIANGG